MHSVPLQFEALIFDCDGTLADTMPLHWEAWHKVTRRHGVHFPEERFYALGGVPARHILEMLKTEQSLQLDPLVVAEEKESEYISLLPRVGPVPEVVQVARDHYGKIPMAVASGGIRPHIEQVLSHLGIRQYFDAVVTSEDVIHQKPAPDIYLRAAAALGVTPRMCQAFEDTDLGLRAIVAAGMTAVDIRPMRRAMYPPPASPPP